MNHQSQTGISIPRILLGLMLCVLSFADASAQDSKLKSTSSQTKVKSALDGFMAFQGMHINLAARKIQIPVEINMCEGPIEYVLVHQSGKTHESVFKTAIKAQDLNAALLLFLPKEKPAPTRMLHEFKIQLSILGKTKAGDGWKVSADRWILNDVLQKKMKPGPWGYLGSRMEENVYVAARDGSLIAVREDADAVIGNPRPESAQDDIWRALVPDSYMIGDKFVLELTIPKIKK